MARGASFDLTLEYDIGRAMGDEMVASQHNNLLSPTTNILRHPLWGRSQETYGEDTFHLGRLGTANVVGIQEYVPACAKHYAANNIEANRAMLNASMDEQTLQEIYARHFQMMIVDGGVSCIMAAYNAVNGTKSTQNNHLLNELLRQQFGFKGFVLSDWWAMPGGSGTISTDQQRVNAAQAINAGLDMELPWNYNFSQLEAQVSANAVTGDTLRNAALRVLREKYRFNVAIGTGLRAATTQHNGQNSIVNNDAHIDLARRAALKGMVLLKNDGNALPIKQAGRTVNSVAVIGKRVNWTITGSGTTLSGTVDFARDIRVGDVGSSRVLPDPAKTVGPAAGIMAAGGGTTVTVSNDVSAANTADFIVVVAGLTQQDEGEEYTGSSDRSGFSLDAKTNQGQNQLIMDVAAIARTRAKPMAVILEGGGVIDMPWLSMLPPSSAVVMAWYPGQAGGTALGQVLFATPLNPTTLAPDAAGVPANFSGKLPVTWSTTGWPTFNEGTTTAMAYNLGYRRFDAMGTALNPANGQYYFGHGLSYAGPITYMNVKVPCSDVKPTANIPVTIDVYNTSTTYDADETILVFVRYLDAAPAGVMRSPKELKAFRRVNLPKGVGKQITIDVRASDLKVYDPTSRTMKVPTSGRVQVLVGPSADRSKLLPASDSDTSTVFNLVP